MPRSLRVFICVVGFLIGPVSNAKSSHLLNALAGRVGKENLTIQDAYIFRALQRFRTGEKPFVFFEKDQALKRTIEKLMFEKMLLAEVKAVEFKDPDPTKAKEFVRQVEASGKSRELASIANEFDLTEEELTQILQQHFLAEAFLQKKLITLTPVITSSEVDAYLLKHPEKVKKLSGDKRSVVSEVIKQERMNKALQDYIDFLTEKYSATLLFS